MDEMVAAYCANNCPLCPDVSGDCLVPMARGTFKTVS